MVDPRYSMLQQGMMSGQSTYPSMQPQQNSPMQAMQPYPNMVSPQNDTMSYNMNNANALPQQMPSNTNESTVYPYEDQQIPNQQGYARGGKVKKKPVKKGKKQENDNLYPLLAELVRQQGATDDTILAHINPVEAQILGLMNGNGGSVNPKTGLPQFSFLTKPGKALRNTFKNPKRLLADTVGTGGALLGAMTGNPVTGGAIGGGLRSMIKGKGENPLIGALKGGAYGMGANLVGQGLTALGSTSVGPALAGQGSLGAYNLSNLGNSAWGVAPNARDAFQVAEASGMGTHGGSSLLNAMSSGVPRGGNAQNMQGMSAQNAAPMDFMDKVKNSLTDPATLISLGGLGLQGYGAYQTGKENEKARKEAKQERDPEYRATREKAARKAMRLSPAELDELIAYEELEEQSKSKRKARNDANFKPVYRKQHTPAEHARTGKWFSYYDNPNFNGAPLYAEGGKVSPLIEMMGKPQVDFELDEMEPRGLGYHLEGHTGGQDDKIPAYLSDGEYVIDASTVANLGDGNNKAGARKLDQMVKNVRKHKGGSINLPPKAKSLIDYMR